MNELNLNDVLAFVRVVESGSLSAAASRLALSKSSVSRRLTALEETLGVRLLQRTSRSIALTDAGKAYYEQVSSDLSGILRASSEASDSTARGIVRFSAPYDFGAEALPKLIQRFLTLHPEIDVDLQLMTEPPNLVEQSLDFAIVGGQQPDSSIVIRKLHETLFRLYASPAYLSRAGEPRHSADLERHDGVLFFGRRGATRWELQGPQGPVEITMRGRVDSNSLAFSRRAAIAGLGIALLPEVPGEIAVRRGLLRPVLPELAMSSSPLFLIYPSMRHLPQRVKLLRDYMIEHFPTIEDLDDTDFE